MTTNSDDQFPVILVEDDDDLREAIAITLRMKGIEYVTHRRAETVLPLLHPELKTVLITDYKLPGMTGIDLLKTVHKQCPELPVIVMTAFADTKLAVEALKAGARDFLIKPFVPEQLIEIISRYRSINNTKHVSEAQPAPNKAKIEANSPTESTNVIAVDPATVGIFNRSKRVAVTDTSVLITGESGTGKELVARHIHQESKRAAGPYVAINCAAIPDTLLESILFGHEKGSFTGANKMQAGKFEQANHGTLFLDEIGEMPAPLQAKLLRVLQDKVVERIGSSESLQADVRIIAATNLNLQEQVRAGKFREDLYFRLAVFPIHIPRLQDRPLDILPLADFFLKKYSINLGRDSLKLSTEAQKAITNYPWPGNVRELENIIQRSVLLADHDVIEPQDLELDNNPPSGALRNQVVETAFEIAPKMPQNGTNIASESTGSQDIETIERDHILKVLAEVKGNRTKAVEILGISARALRYKLKSYKEAGFHVD